ncbi:MAG: CARDB domain-containing protein [bacterium]
MKPSLLKLSGFIAPLLLILSSTAHALPDLTVLSINSVTSAGTGQSVSLTNTLANIAPDPADNWRYRIFISTNSSITTNDVVLGTFGTYFNFGGLTTITNVDTVMIPGNNPTGTYYFGIIVDYDNSVTESIETNNMRASAPVSIYPGPDLTVVSVRGPAAAGTAQMLTLTNILANTGVGTAGNWQYRIYLSTNSTLTTNATVLTTQGTYVDFPMQSSMTNYDTITIPSGTTPGIYYFGVIIDFNNMVAESSKANNTNSSSAVAISFGPDLSVPSVSGPSSAGTAQMLTLTNILSNSGIGAAGAWRYRIFLSTNSSVATNDTVLTTQSGYIDFPAQSSMTNKDTVLIPADTKPGTYYFGVIIDDDHKVFETDEGNNTRSSAAVTISIGPDLTVPAIGYPSVAGTAQTLILTNVLANIGVGAAGNWKFRVYLSTNATSAATNGIVLTTQGAFVDIAAQTAVTNTGAVTIPGNLATGTYYFATLIDFDNSVTESIETNNIRVSGPVTIGIGPDLTVLAVTVPNGGGPGLGFTVTERLANIGIGTAGPWSYRIYLSTNASVTTNDTILTTQGSFISIPAQTSLTNTDSVTIPQGTAPGAYYLGVIIDFDNVVLESNEGNNTLISLALPVGPMITAITIRTNIASVDVSGLAISDGYSLQYNSTLTGTNLWTTGTLFTAQGIATNCTDSVPPSTTTRFYRIGHQ